MSVSLRLMDRFWKSSRLPRIHRGLLDDSRQVSSLGADRQARLVRCINVNPQIALVIFQDQSITPPRSANPGVSPTVRIGKPRTICTQFIDVYSF